MPKPKTKGFQKPIDSGSRKPVGLASIREGVSGDQHYAECSCGAPFYHERKKVLQRNVDRHVNAKHGGRAIWL